ncbi:nitrate reductase associated protein [Pleurocapsales cyanobacterium LEGE 10410]|nr:nitrate reductase associated protein [Pleurocapsales cyanobacterium LEGE 10410]
MKNNNLPSQSQPQPSNYFQFEADFVNSLRCIPMQVRMKLDNCGVKLKLAHWNQFSQLERQNLVDLPCTTQAERQTYREFLQNLITAKTGKPAKELAIDPHPSWLDETKIPLEVRGKAEEFQVDISLEQWSNLTPARRFALIKLSRPSHENKNFVPALREFGILSNS